MFTFFMILLNLYSVDFKCFISSSIEYDSHCKEQVNFQPTLVVAEPLLILVL